MRNITVLGASGDAAGQALLSMTCTLADCTDAVRACRAEPRCDTVEMRLVARKQQKLRRRNGTPLPVQEPTAVLRASWATWGSRDPKLAGEVQACKRLESEARRVPPGKWMMKHVRLAWQHNYCDEYVAIEGSQLPDFGRELTAAESTYPAGGAHCPPADTKLFVVTYQNGPSPWLCTFLRTLGYQNVHVTVLGWQPRAFVRLNNVFYFTDRVYTLLRYLLHCPSLSADASIMFCDVDELYQLQGGLAELTRLSHDLYARTRARVVISAEARCMPNKLGKIAWAHSEAAAGVMHKKWPRCLNTGNFVGRIRETVDLLNQTCLPCRTGLSIDDIFRRYTRAYSAQVTDWVYSEQAELMRLYLARPANVSGWILDYKQQLFHPSFWFTASWDTKALADGRIHNVHTGSTPAFMHYNGDSKRTWRGPFSPRALARALRKMYVARTGDTHLRALESYLSQGVSFLGPTFARDSTVGWKDICSQGSMGGDHQKGAK